MALTQTELTTLQYHLSNHPYIPKLENNYQDIANWYNSIPSGKLIDLIQLLSPLDRKNYFSFIDFPKWYSELNNKIHNNTTIKIFGLTNEQINEIAINLLSALIEYSLTEPSMQQLVQDILRRQLYSVLDNLLKCLGANGDFQEITLFLLNIDIQPFPRWQSLGLSEAPTSAEIQSLLP